MKLLSTNTVLEPPYTRHRRNIQQDDQVVCLVSWSRHSVHMGRASPDVFELQSLTDLEKVYSSSS